MGAIPYGGGTTFRVWAPFAATVSVAGNFNAWSETANPLFKESTGHWSADIPGVAAGDLYKFVIPGRWDRWVVDPRAKDVTQSNGDAIVISDTYSWQIENFRLPAWNDLVIYEMHVGTFPDRPTTAPDLFAAVINDLDYLVDLGINVIHLLPTHEFPTDNSWGYNPSHIFSIESAYGGPDALKALVDAAHGRGIGIVMDVVYNHLGPNDLSVWQIDGWFQHWNEEAMGGIYFYNDWRAHTPWGAKNRPDYGRAEVREYIHANAMMWLDEYRMDGLRFDATNYIRNVYGRNDPVDDSNNLAGWGWNLLRWVNDDINTRHPNRITIAEDMQDNAAVTAATSAGGAGFGTQWDANFHHTLKQVLAQARDEDRDMESIRTIVEKSFGDDPFKRVIYSESHDEVAVSNGKQRVPEAIHPGSADSWFAKKRSTLGAAVVMTSPGIPMLFQGQEILEWIPFGDANYLDWDKYDRFRGIYRLYSDLVRLRRNSPNHTRGLRGRNRNVYHVNNADKVIAFHRWLDGGPGDDVVVVLNFANRAYASYCVGFPRPGAWFVRFNSDWSGYSPDFSSHHSYDTMAESGPRDGLRFQGNVGVGPYSAVILSQ